MTADYIAINEVKMPPQKNSGNKRSKKESGTVLKNRRFFQNFLADVRSEEGITDVYVSRVLRKMGNGRMEVFYIDSRGNAQIKQALIRGSFRGKGKHGVWIDVGSFVIIGDSGVGGSAEFGIMAVLSPDDMRLLKTELDVDPRILAVGNVDGVALQNNKFGDEIIFEDVDEPDSGNNTEEEIIKREERNKARPKPELDLTEADIDDI